MIIWILRLRKLVPKWNQVSECDPSDITNPLYSHTAMAGIVLGLNPVIKVLHVPITIYPIYYDQRSAGYFTNSN